MPVDLRRGVVMGAAALLLASLTGRAEPRVQDDATATETARRAGIAWSVRKPPREAGDLWMLSMLDDPSAQAIVREASERPGLPPDPYAGLYTPGADGGELPKAWARLGRNAYGRMAGWLHAAANAPGRTPPAGLVESLVTERNADYVRTHQYLTLRLLRDRGCAGGLLVEAALERLLDEIEAEQRSDPWFSDLAAERIAVLLFGGRSVPEMPAWIGLLVDAQEPDGRWRVVPHPYPVGVSDGHATLVTLWALDQWRRLVAETR